MGKVKGASVGAAFVSPEAVQARRQARMRSIDAMPTELRQLVYEYGYAVVLAFLDCGVRKPRHIRHLVERVLDEFSPTRGRVSCQGPTSKGARLMTREHIERGGYE